MILLAPRAGEAQQRMIVSTGAVCRARQDTSAPVVHAYRLGEIFGIRAQPAGADTNWLFDSWHTTGLKPTCWLQKGLSTPFSRDNSEAALVVLADRMLQRSDKVRFEEYVGAENLLIGPHAPALASSGPLQYRRLLLVAKAADAMYVQYGVGPNELATSWALAHREFVRHSPFSSNWDALPEPYWQLFDSYKDSSWADDIAWTAAQLRGPADECYSDCVLRVGIIDGPLQYWTRLPSGKNVENALRLASGHAKHAVDVACYDSAKPVPHEFRLIESIRASLSKVDHKGKDELLDHLAQVEAICRKK